MERVPGKLDGESVTVFYDTHFEVDGIFYVMPNDPVHAQPMFVTKDQLDLFAPSTAEFPVRDGPVCERCWLSNREIHPLWLHSG